MSATAQEPLNVQLKQQALALARAGLREDALQPVRRDALALLEHTEFPDKRTEQWKYTSLQVLTAGHLSRVARATEAPLPAPLATHRLVLINGHYQPALSQLPDNITLTRFDGSSALSAETASDTLRTPFAWWNNATLHDGLQLSIADDTVIDAPVEVLLLATDDAPSHCQTRLRVQLGRHSRATLIERYAATGPVLTNAVTELVAGAGSQLTHYRLQAEHPESLHIGTLVIAPGRDSNVQSFQLMQGNVLRRNDVRAIMAESGASLTMSGIFVGRGNSHIDNQITVEHRVPHCHSEQLFKGMAGDTARLVFNGRIHIFEGAKGTNAELSNKNLLLTPGAEVDTKPELEIYNDDVKCSHGTTCGQLDAQSLFYLRSRGIEAAEAKRMLGFGFVNELLSALPDQAVAEWARPWLEQALTEAEPAK